MLRALLIWPVFLCLSLCAASADARMSVLVDVIKLREAVQILSAEGVNYAQSINEDMLDGEGGSAWQIQVEAIYSPERMAETIRQALRQSLTPDEVEAIIAFYASDLGGRVINLENSARVVIQDPDIENATQQHYLSLKDAGAPRYAVIAQYMENGDMVMRNTTNMINSNFEYLRGLTEGGAIEMSEAEMLREAADGYEDTRQNTQDWLSAYLLLAYDPLSDAELDAFVTFSATPAGQAFNAALYAGFQQVYEDIFYTLGRAVALNMQAQDL